MTHSMGVLAIIIRDPKIRAHSTESHLSKKKRGRKRVYEARIQLYFLHTGVVLSYRYTKFIPIHLKYTYIYTYNIHTVRRVGVHAR